MVQIRVAESFDHQSWASAHGLSIIAERGERERPGGGLFLAPERGTREVHIEFEAANEDEAEMRVRHALGRDGVILILRRAART